MTRAAFVHWIVNFYPRSPCGERPINVNTTAANIPISIHALHAESDLINSSKVAVLCGISIHALHAESDSKRLQKICNLLFGMP